MSDKFEKDSIEELTKSGLAVHAGHINETNKYRKWVKSKKSSIKTNHEPEDGC